MTKEDVINRFKVACLKPENTYYRVSAVKYQYSRHVWELTDEQGKVQINGNRLNITSWNLIGFDPSVMFEISSQEFLELQEMFFGDIKKDFKYLSRWYDYPEKLIQKDSIVTKIKNILRRNKINY